MKNNQDFVLDTLRPYFLDRSLLSFRNVMGYEDEVICMYLSPSGNKCAIGQHITDYNPMWDEKLGVKISVVMSGLPPKVQSYGIERLRAMQRVHDSLAMENNTLDEIYRCEREWNIDLSELKNLLETV